MIQNEADSCLCARTKHNPAYEAEPSILLLMFQNPYVHTTEVEVEKELNESERVAWEWLKCGVKVKEE